MNFSLVRGFAFALPVAGVGFTLPLVVLRSGVLGERYPFSEAWYPAFGCGFVFGLVAILNYTPAARIGLLRAIIFVGLATMGGGLVSSIMTAIFGLQPRAYDSDPWQWLRVFVAFLIPLIYTVLHTAMRLHSRNAAI